MSANHIRHPKGKAAQADSDEGLGNKEVVEQTSASRKRKATGGAEVAAKKKKTTTSSKGTAALEAKAKKVSQRRERW
ncbi:hypothetical protein JBE27_55745 [Streptomyces albiflaviniger]|nr:hypothetical protein [Streptomyces albiflaviniger]